MSSTCGGLKNQDANEFFFKFTLPFLNLHFQGLYNVHAKSEKKDHYYIRSPFTGNHFQTFTIVSSLNFNVK